MKTKTILVLGLVAVIGLAVAGRRIFKQSAPQETARANTERIVAPEQRSNPTPPAVTPTPTPDPSPVEKAGNLSDSAPPPQKAKTDAAQKVASQSSPNKKPKPPLQDPDARVALTLVGVDPVAEAYWLEAIFDSSLPDKEREDLMEDLNEEGLSDPKRPGPQDFPLIMIRIEKIEEIAPHADPFMLPHLAEAYKDLVNLLNGYEAQ
jgi:hypothetical protein